MVIFGSPTSMAFCLAPFPMSSTRRSRATQITMRKSRRKGPGPKGPKGPQRMSKQQEEKLEKLASNYGIHAPKPGDSQDRQFTQGSSSSPPPALTLYQSLAGSVGVETLDAAERVVFVVLGGLLFAFIAGGLAISSEAFFKASGKDVPEGLDAIIMSVETAFTPIALAFLALSSMYGVYKQSQLNSGATTYGATRDDKDAR